MHLNDLLKVLKKFYDMRNDALKESDLNREKDPTWYKRNDLTGMMMYVNAFAGTLSNLESKLDYIQECNVNYLHLMPLLDSPRGRSDGGYAVADFRKVQEELGTMDDFAALTPLRVFRRTILPDWLRRLGRRCNSLRSLRRLQ